MLLAILASLGQAADLATASLGHESAVTLGRALLASGLAVPAKLALVALASSYAALYPRAGRLLLAFAAGAGVVGTVSNL